MTEPSSENDTERTPRFGLSGKLLLLTILFVMIAEVLIYVPSIANYRLNWLADRLAVARTVAIVLNANNDPTEVPGQPEKFKLPENVVLQVLDNLGAKMVAVKTGNQRKLLAVNDMPHEIHHDIDLRETSSMRAIWRAIDTLLFSSDTDVMRIVGQGPPGTDFIEIVIDQSQLRAKMFGVLAQHPSALAFDFGDHRDAGLSLAALSVRAAAEPADDQHGELPRGSGECLPYCAAFRPLRRDWHCGA